jgi:hypothetical protein
MKDHDQSAFSVGWDARKRGDFLAGLARVRPLSFLAFECFLDGWNAVAEYCGNRKLVTQRQEENCCGV